MCVNFETTMENGLVFPHHPFQFLTVFLLMSCNCQRKNNLFLVLCVNNKGKWA